MAVVVPSDISLLENKMSIGRRKLRILERTGLALTAPMLHIHYSKIDGNDMKAVLQKKYDPEDKSETATVCKKRQESIRKRVVCTNYMWGIAGASAGMVTWSFRRYNYQSRLIALPFIFYGMTFVGRYMGDAIVGRNAEYGRDRFLGELPGKVYYTPQED
mmetsp:Transcript_114166/g.180252  ORF Transcript_114166/g.180252 Transcript_114166/m.180252 type:complete len:160 (-) Transcript_114166:176-655(-)